MSENTGRDIDAVDNDRPESITDGFSRLTVIATYSDSKTTETLTRRISPAVSRVVTSAEPALPTSFELYSIYSRHAQLDDDEFYRDVVDVGDDDSAFIFERKKTNNSGYCDTSLLWLDFQSCTKHVKSALW